MRNKVMFTANDGSTLVAVISTESALGAYDLPGFVGRATIGPVSKIITGVHRNHRTAMDVAKNNLFAYRDSVFND